jgi:hypothetical protein
MKTFLTLVALGVLAAGCGDKTEPELEVSCTMNGFGDGACAFTNTSDSPASLCGKVLVYRNEVINSSSRQLTPVTDSATLCSGSVQGKSTASIEFHCHGMYGCEDRLFPWSLVCDFVFVPIGKEAEFKGALAERAAWLEEQIRKEEEAKAEERKREDARICKELEAEDRKKRELRLEWEKGRKSREAEARQAEEAKKAELERVAKEKADTEAKRREERVRADKTRDAVKASIVWDVVDGVAVSSVITVDQYVGFRPWVSGAVAVPESKGSPVVRINRLLDAAPFCSWIGAELPDKTEWGTLVKKGRYPWDKSEISDRGFRCAVWRDTPQRAGRIGGCDAKTGEVGSYWEVSGVVAWACPPVCVLQDVGRC